MSSSTVQMPRSTAWRSDSACTCVTRGAHVRGYERRDVGLRVPRLAETSERPVVVGEVRPPPFLEAGVLLGLEAATVHDERGEDPARPAVAVLERMDGSEPNVRQRSLHRDGDFLGDLEPLGEPVDEVGHLLGRGRDEDLAAAASIEQAVLDGAQAARLLHVRVGEHAGVDGEDELSLPAEVGVVRTQEHVSHGIRVASDEIGILDGHLSWLLPGEDAPDLVDGHRDALHRRGRGDSLGLEFPPHPPHPPARQRAAGIESHPELLEQLHVVRDVGRDRVGEHRDSRRS